MGVPGAGGASINKFCFDLVVYYLDTGLFSGELALIRSFKVAFLIKGKLIGKPYAH
jgi:hypothetical protein